MNGKIRVTVWNEGRHEKTKDKVKAVYPDGMHAAIAAALNAQLDIEARTATLDEPDHGLPDEVLEGTDVLTWWGHVAHKDVRDDIVDRVHQRVLRGMGIIVLHSGHFSKIFRRLMGTNCSLRWREIGEKERLWVVEPSHPITQGIGPYIELPHSEMYGERFDVPPPDELVFLSWFAGGDVFRGGCTWHRGHGKVFYFCPGHETYPIFHDKDIQRVLVNAVRWAKPTVAIETKACAKAEPLEDVTAA